MKTTKAVKELVKLTKKDELSKSQKKESKKLVGELKSKRSKIKSELKKTSKNDKKKVKKLKNKQSLIKKAIKKSSK
ncbi:hypothetical protein AAX26_00609 [Aliarcobacter thereius]|uniref:Uncharacterized protein n=1 Tax=Aliarcobacter thereius TaxID=544718 RepID=A0A5R9HB43_9BACT|nr:hypothetical protein [Aliarcobacter thereius]OCL87524.1 hypothetical protein AAX26_00609 [Aliarcobacter thereius]TLS73303.1 hypothetical protein FE246_02110 [Aliarcobacter thereius]TLT08713.1 hypothetical protein FE243_02100 [Aliarcobacter thereius]HJE03231.1 hypothetical protein [Aliarcobacter thereius]